MVTSDAYEPGGDIPLVPDTEMYSGETEEDEYIEIPEGCTHIIFDIIKNVPYGKFYNLKSIYFKTKEKLSDIGISNYIHNIGDDVLLSSKTVKDYMDIISSITIDNGEVLTSYEKLSSTLLKIDGTLIDLEQSRVSVRKYNIEEDVLYRIDCYRSLRNENGVNVAAAYVFLNDEDNVISYNDSVSTQTPMRYEIVRSPVGATKLYVSGHDTVQDQYVAKIQQLGEETTIYPKTEYGFVSRLTGDYNNNYNYYGFYHTPRFIALKDNSYLKVTCGKSGYIFVVYYDKNYQYLKGTTYLEVEGNVERKLDCPTDAKYVKINFINNTNYDGNGKTTIKVKGVFEDKWDIFNIRPSDDGYQRITVLVNVTHPDCTDEITDGFQDSAEYLTDYGVVCLPEKYTNTGEPTRLIIYCHGAAVNYSSSVSRFNTQDLEPEYWLSEGYAVMDIEGNPFDNTNEHFYIPQAMESYIAAYKWVIEHYNIKRDGVFLSGRSMGGGMTFNLLRRECPIPVIAACPNVPCIFPTFYWNYMTAARRTFCANHLGFINQPTWTSESPMSEDEWNCLKENFDKLVKYSPTWGIITDLPTKDVLFDNSMNISKNASHSDAEEQVYGKLHAQVKSPVKLFGCLNDTTCYVDRTSRLCYKMLINSGQIVELRLFNEGNHHYDTQNSDLRVGTTEEPFINSFGEELINVPVVYIEMLQFWRRYEQNS